MYKLDLFLYCNDEEYDVPQEVFDDVQLMHSLVSTLETIYDNNEICIAERNLEQCGGSEYVGRPYSTECRTLSEAFYWFIRDQLINLNQRENINPVMRDVIKAYSKACTCINVDEEEGFFESLSFKYPSVRDVYYQYIKLGGTLKRVPAKPHYNHRKDGQSGFRGYENSRPFFN